MLPFLLVIALLGGQTPPPQGAPRPPQRITPPGRTPEVILLKGPLRVFLDCQYECDTDFIRKELTFVDHVRDSQSADIHALVTTERTGGGGWNWRIEFIGQGRFAGHDETVTFATAQTDSPDNQRRVLLRWLKLGLATHAAIAAGHAEIDVTHNVQPTAAASEPVRDPWNAWVFSLNTNGNLSGEASSRSNSMRFNTSASRVTDAWKFSLNGNWNRNSSHFDVSDSERVKSLTRSWNTSALAVKSLGPKFSAAARATVSGSTFSNYDYNARVMAGVEYDIFLYADSTRRSLTFSYLAGVAHYNFEAVTIFDKLTETNLEHTFGASLGLRQPWGSVGLQSSFGNTSTSSPGTGSTSMATPTYGSSRASRSKSTASTRGSAIRSISAKAAPLRRRCCCGSVSSPPAFSTSSASA